MNVQKKMSTEEYQPNIRIEPDLLIALKLEAIKNGISLSSLINEKLKQFNIEKKNEILEQKLLSIEKRLNSLSNFKLEIENKATNTNSIFSDAGAEQYGKAAKDFFDMYRDKMKQTFDQAFDELLKFLAKYEGQPELVRGILSGKHVLTGLEMTNAYRNGSCGMRSALNDWSKTSSEKLDETFLEAVEFEKLN